MSPDDAMMPGHTDGTKSSGRAAAGANDRTLKKPRIRTSTACCACRERRIRCVVPNGNTKCTYCDQTDMQCIIPDNDERKRPTSKAYTSTLTNRIQLLEKMLLERGAEPPPVVYPPKTKNRRASSALEQPAIQEKRKRTKSEHIPIHESTQNFIHQTQSINYTQNVEHCLSGNQNTDSFETLLNEFGRSVSNSPVYEADLPKNSELIDKLLSNRGHLGVDEQSGQEHYYGSTTNCHVYSAALGTMKIQKYFRSPNSDKRELPEQVRRTGKIIRALSLDLHDYLMDTFFQRYNTVMPIVHERAFLESREKGSSLYYSGFLHICILAMGYRFADKSREDVKRIAGPDGQKQESSLHKEAKFMLDTELERPGGVTSIQALLLLGELEAGVGRDNTGWMYGGMACRLAFDIGLHLDSRRMGLQEIDVEIRDMTLWACVCSDKYWALYLGRPTSMKKSDMKEMYQATQASKRLGNCLPSGPEKTLETQTYEALLDLMDLAGKTTEIGGHTATIEKFDYELYTRVSALDAELRTWSSSLPEELRWTPENIKTAPLGFFLLHQQYHCAMILLHRPFTLYPASVSVAGSPPADSQDRNDTLLSTISRKACTSHAVQVAKIAAEHRDRFGGSQIFFSTIQHTGTAATSLIGSLLHSSDSEERKEYMQHLECLAVALSDMTDSYKPAEAVSDVLRAVMMELREPLGNSPGSKGAVSPICNRNADVGSPISGVGGNYVGTPDYNFALQNTLAAHPYDALYGFMGSDMVFSNYLTLDHTTVE